MPPPDVGVPNRHVVLEIGATERHIGQRAAAASIQEQSGLLEIPALAGGPAELGETYFDLRMPTDLLPAVRAEGLADMIGGPPGDPHQFILAVRAQPGDRRLQEVADVVELMAHLQIGVPTRLSGMPESCSEIAVLVLRGSNSGGQPADRRFGCCAAGPPRFPGQGLQQLVDLGVREYPPRAVVTDSAVDHMVEVGQPADPLHPAFAMCQRGGGVDLLPLPPEAAQFGDLPQAQRSAAPAGRQHRAAARRVRRERRFGVGDRRHCGAVHGWVLGDRKWRFGAPQRDRVCRPLSVRGGSRRRGGRCRPGQSLTAPAVTPAATKRCASISSTAAGMEAITAVAMIAFHWVVLLPM